MNRGIYLIDIHKLAVEVLSNTKGKTGNPVKEILLKLNLPDHRSILTDSKEQIKMEIELTVLTCESSTNLEVSTGSVKVQQYFLREGSKVQRNIEGGRPSEQRAEDNGSQEMNLPPLLTAHLGRMENGQPLPSSLTFAPKGSNIPAPHGLIPPSSVFPNNYPFNAQPMYPSLNAPIYPNHAPSGLFADYTGCVTPFVHGIKDYPFLDGLKIPSHVGSYDDKEDPDNFLHLFEGAIRMQKWAMPVACHMFTYTLKDSAQIWWNGQKAAIKFYTPKGVATVLSTYEPDKTGEGQKKLKETLQEAMKDVISCMNVVEEVFINDKYPDQIVVIGRQLPTSFKKRLRDLLKENIDIFAWTYSDMTEIPRTIMVGGRPFITEHRLNELKHIELRKQKKRGLAPERSKALHKEVEDLTKAN
ncbi:hypothetical protein Tco_0417710, partial [Tanacetum coccineum]